MQKNKKIRLTDSDQRLPDAFTDDGHLITMITLRYFLSKIAIGQKSCNVKLDKLGEMDLSRNKSTYCLDNNQDCLDKLEYILENWNFKTVTINSKVKDSPETKSRYIPDRNRNGIQLFSIKQVILERSTRRS